MANTRKKYTVNEAITFLQQFPNDADVRGFGRINVVTKPVVTPVTPKVTDAPAA